MNESEGLALKGVFTVSAYRKGKLLWEEKFANRIVDTGINAAMNTGIDAATWYAALMGNTTVVAGTTMSTITEITAYSEGTRPVWDKTLTANQITNAASVAAFTISADSTVIYGAFITSSNTKGATTGTLLAAKQFTGGAKTLDTDDIINITYEINGSSS